MPRRSSSLPPEMRTCRVCRGNGVCPCPPDSGPYIRCQARYYEWRELDALSQGARVSVLDGVVVHEGMTCHNCWGAGERPKGPGNVRHTRAYGELATATIEAWVAANGEMCAGYGCHPHAVARRDLTLDHIVAEARGGALLDPQNAGVLCRSCNARKGARIASTIARIAEQPGERPKSADGLLSVAEVAERAGVTRTTVLRAIHAGRLAVEAAPRTLRPANYGSGYRIDPAVASAVFRLGPVVGILAHRCATACAADLHVSVILVAPVGWPNRRRAERVLCRRLSDRPIIVEACRADLTGAVDAEVLAETRRIEMHPESAISLAVYWRS